MRSGMRNGNCGKMNSILRTGKAGCAKSLVFQALTDLFLIPGQVTTSGTSFGFSDAIDKRIILCDEFTYDAKDVETLKCLLGGMPKNVNKKYAPLSIVSKVRFIILSNNDELFDMNDQIWAQRIFHIKCTVPSGFTNIIRPMHPLAWKCLFQTQVDDRDFIVISERVYQFGPAAHQMGCDCDECWETQSEAAARRAGQTEIPPKGVETSADAQSIFDQPELSDNFVRECQKIDLKLKSVI